MHDKITKKKKTRSSFTRVRFLSCVAFGGVVTASQCSHGRLLLRSTTTIVLLVQTRTKRDVSTDSGDLLDRPGPLPRFSSIRTQATCQPFQSTSHGLHRSGPRPRSKRGRGGPRPRRAMSKRDAAGEFVLLGDETFGANRRAHPPNGRRSPPRTARSTAAP